jgi:hypothetical protein
MAMIMLDHSSSKPTPSHVMPGQMAMIMVVPSLLDLVGTALAKVGLLYCTVSVYQLVR